MKSKLLLLMCLVGTLNFSCSDSDDTIELVAGKLNVTEAKAGDELIITGSGFSTVKEENLVKLNELTLSVLEATESELTLIVPEEAATGNLTVTVEDQSVDFGVFKVLKKTVIALKSDYDANKDFIVTVDPETGGETIVMELSQIGYDSWYSDLCYLEKSNEFIVLQKSEDQVEYHINDLKLLIINADSKEYEESKLTIRDGVIDVDLMSDGVSNLYLEDFHEYDVAYKQTYYKLDVNTGDVEFITEVNNDYVKKSRVNENSLFILMEDRSIQDDSPNRLVSYDLSNGTVKDIITGMTYVNGFSFGLNNNIYLATRDSYQSESTLFELDITSGTKRDIVKMPKIYGWYAGAVYIEESDELVYFLSDHEASDDYTDYFYKINVTDKSINTVDSKNSGEFIYRNVQVIYY